VARITAQELLAALRRIEARGRHETAHRVRALAGTVLRYAVATGRAQHDVAADLRDALASVKSRNFASVTEPRRVGELMRAIYSYDGDPVTALALKLAPLVFVRAGELRAAEWSEFDLANAEWRIPANRMKMKEPHIVPLAYQAVEILGELEPLAQAAGVVASGSHIQRSPYERPAAPPREGPDYGADTDAAVNARLRLCARVWEAL